MTRLQQWDLVAAELGMDTTPLVNVAQCCRRAYSKYLYDFELSESDHQQEMQRRYNDAKMKVDAGEAPDMITADHMRNIITITQPPNPLKRPRGMSSGGKKKAKRKRKVVVEEESESSSGELYHVM